MKKSPRTRDAAAMFVLLALTYGFFFQAATWGAAARFDLSRAIVEQRTIRIDAYHENTGDKALLEERYYSDKAPLPSFLATPGVALAHGLRAVTGMPASESIWLAVAGGFATFFATGLVTALVPLILLFFLAKRTLMTVALLTFALYTHGPVGVPTEEESEAVRLIDEGGMQRDNVRRALELADRGRSPG